MQIRRILCPVDFSDASTTAVDRAAPLARLWNARLTVLHAYASVARPPTLPVPDAGGALPPDADTIDRLADQAASVVAADAGIRVEVSVVPGEPVGAILELARTLPADLIAMGTHGAGGFRHLILGSVTEKVLRQAPCPVLTVPPGVQASPAGVTHVICAVDLTDGTNEPVQAAATLAQAAGATLTLLHVIEWPWHEPPEATGAGVPPEQARALHEYREYLEDGASDRLGDLATTLPAGLDVRPQVRFGKPYVELLEEARTAGADLLVLGVRGRNALDIAMFGSTTNHIVRHATCPVLTVPA
ncbi:MAG: universal stress protein [Vicinamibacterales bacterium]